MRRFLAIVAIVALPLAAEVTGNVIDLHGEPVAGVRVTATAMPARSATTDAKGAFALDAGDGFVELAFEKDGYGAQRARVPADEQSITIVLVRGTSAGETAIPDRADSARTETITGIVRDEAKRPVAGIEVAARERYFYAAATTGVKGEFVLKVRPGEYEVSIFGNEYVYAGIARVRAGKSCELIAKRSPRIDGVVLDFDGKPIRGARVTFVEESSYTPLARAVITDAAGRFRMHAWPRMQGRFVAQKAALPVTSLPLPDLEKARYAVTLKFPRGIDVKGMVTGEDGRGLAGVSINQADSFGSLFQEDLPFEDWAETAKDGTFSVRIEQLSTELHFAKDRYVTAVVPIEVTPSIRPLTVRLKQLNFVRGKLVRKDGTAVAGEPIMSPDLPGEMTNSADDGSFELAFPAAGEFSVDAGLINTRQSVRAPSDDVRIIYDEGLTISGQVVDEATGAPVEAVGSVTAKSESTPYSVPVMLPAGRFKFAGFEDETVTISVLATGYVPAQATAEAGQPEPLIIKLKRGSTLHGRVHDANGKPVAVAVIAAGEAHVTSSDRDGAFEVKGLASDVPAALRITKEDYLPASVAIAPADLGKVADVLLLPGFSVKGQVLGPDGKPVAIHIYAKSAGYDTGAKYAESGADGQFEIKGLSPGRYDFRVEDRGLLSGAVRDVDVEHVHELTIQLERGPSGVVSGRVSGIPSAFTRRTVAINSGEPMNLNADGTFRFEGVPSGPAAVIASAGDPIGVARAVTKEIDVPAGGETSVEIVFEPLRRLTGRVTRGGQPVGAAHVEFHALDVAVAIADADGRYEARLEPGRYGVTLLDRQVQIIPFRGEVDVSRTSVYDISIETREIRVRVVDAETGQPLRNATVAFAENERDNQDKTTAPDGTAVLEIARGINGVLRIFKEGYAAAGADAGESDVTVKLVRPAELAVRVVDARDGQTLKACVVAHDLAGRPVVATSTAMANGVTLLHVGPGEYRIVAAAEGYALSSVRASAPSSELRIGLRRGGTLVLRSHEDLRGTVRLLNTGGEIYHPFPCDSVRVLFLDGRVTTIENIAAGSYTLELTPAGGKPRRYSVTVMDGVAVPVPLD